MVNVEEEAKTQIELSQSNIQTIEANQVKHFKHFKSNQSNLERSFVHHIHRWRRQYQQEKDTNEIRNRMVTTFNWSMNCHHTELDR